MTLIEFLQTRIAEDEAIAVAGRHDEHTTRGKSMELRLELVNGYAHVATTTTRVLAECASKRRVIDALEVLFDYEKTYGERLRHTAAEDSVWVISRDALRALAAPYAAHPDFDPSWGA